MAQRMELVTVTPELAGEWLGKNLKNRSIRNEKVARYMRDMGAGKWRLTGEPLMFDPKGWLLNGQHRLMACEACGVSFETWVCWGVPREAQESMDSGAKRTLSDVLRLRELPNAHQLAAAVVLGWRWEVPEAGSLQRHTAPSVAEATEWLDANGTIADAVRDAAPFLAAPLRVPSSVMAPFLLAASKVAGDDTVSDFMEQFRYGEALEGGNALLALRRYCMLQAALPHGRQGPRQHVRLAILIKGWNAWWEGAEVQQLHWRPSSGELFPALRGSFGAFVEAHGFLSNKQLELMAQGRKFRREPSVVRDPVKDAGLQRTRSRALKGSAASKTTKAKPVVAKGDAS